MITAYQLEKTQKEIVNASKVVYSIAPTAEFHLVGIDNKKIYFNVIARPGQLSDDQKKELSVKTRFVVTDKCSEWIDELYCEMVVL